VSDQPDGFLRSEAGRASRGQSHTKDDQRGKQDERQNHRTRALTCRFWSPRSDSNRRPSDYESDAPSSSRCYRGRSWLLTSAGSSVECVPDLPSHGRGNDQGNDQTDPWRPTEPMATFRSRPEGLAPTRKPTYRRHGLMVGLAPSDTESDGEAITSGSNGPPQRFTAGRVTVGLLGLGGSEQGSTGWNRGGAVQAGPDRPRGMPANRSGRCWVSTGNRAAGPRGTGEPSSQQRRRSLWLAG
jgi:hypothetical protein